MGQRLLRSGMAQLCNKQQAAQEDEPPRLSALAWQPKSSHDTGRAANMNASRPALSRCAHPLTPCSTADQGVRDPADRQQPSGAEARRGKPHVTDSFPLTLPWLPTSCRAPKTGPAVREREREAAPGLSGKDLLRRPWQRPPRGAGREVGSPGPGRAAPAKASPTRNPTYPRRTVPPVLGPPPTDGAGEGGNHQRLRRELGHQECRSTLTCLLTS